MIKKANAPVIPVLVELPGPRRLDTTTPPGIGKHFLHVLGIVNVTTGRSGLEGGVQSLSDFGIGVTERLTGVRFQLQQITGRIKIVKVRQDAPFGRTAIAWIAYVLHYFAQAFEHGRSLLRRY